MVGARAGAGRDEGKRRNGDSVNGEPFSKLPRKIDKLGSQNGEKAGPLTAAQDKSPTSSDVFSPPIPLDGFSSISYSSDFGDTETLQESEKLSLWFPPLAAAEERSSAPRTASPSCAQPRLASTRSESVHNYGPFSPSGSSKIGQTSAKRSPTRIKFKEPKSPAPIKSDPETVPVPEPTPKPKTRLLEPFRTCTYLRPKPASGAPGGAPMGPPAPVNCLTPYQTVKKALTILKNGLDLSSFQSPPEAKATYSLSNLTPELPWTMEQVVLELDQYVSTLPEDSSSRGMESRLTDFQVRLGLPPWPSFYHMLWFGAGDFLYYLSHSFSYEDDEF